MLPFLFGMMAPSLLGAAGIGSLGLAGTLGASALGAAAGDYLDDGNIDPMNVLMGTAAGGIGPAMGALGMGGGAAASNGTSIAANAAMGGAPAVGQAATSALTPTMAGSAAPLTSMTPPLGIDAARAATANYTKPAAAGIFNGGLKGMLTPANVMMGAMGLGGLGSLGGSDDTVEDEREWRTEATAPTGRAARPYTGDQLRRGYEQNYNIQPNIARDDYLRSVSGYAEGGGINREGIRALSSRFAGPPQGDPNKTMNVFGSFVNPPPAAPTNAVTAPQGQSMQGRYFAGEMGPPTGQIGNATQRMNEIQKKYMSGRRPYNQNTAGMGRPQRHYPQTNPYQSPNTVRPTDITRDGSYQRISEDRQGPFASFSGQNQNVDPNSLLARMAGLRSFGSYAEGGEVAPKLDTSMPEVKGAIAAIMGDPNVDPQQAMGALYTKLVQQYGPEEADIMIKELVAMVQGGGSRQMPEAGGPDGMADDMPAMVDGVEPARINSGEMVISKPDLSAIGSGDPDKGIDKVTNLLEQVRNEHTGSKKHPERVDFEGIASKAI